MFNIGDEIILKNYDSWGDYKLHKYQSAIIISTCDDYEFDFRIKWKDKEISLVSKNNIRKANQEWDDEVNR